MESDFFKLRAKELHRIFPSIGSLELTLFTASGWHTEKSRWKASFHAIWHQLIVDRQRAGMVRLATIASFEEISKEEPLKGLLQRLQELDEKGMTLSAMAGNGIRESRLTMVYVRAATGLPKICR